MSLTCNRIAVFGGTFDPVHFGHLRTVVELREKLAFRKVYLIPNRIPPHKLHRHASAFAHRMAMLRLAVGKSSVFHVSAMEGKRSGPSYTIETIEALLRQMDKGAELWLVLGMDSFTEIGTWRRYIDVLNQCHIAVMNRPGSPHFDTGRRAWLPLEIRRMYRYDKSRGVYRNTAGKSLALVGVTPLDISASAVRQAVREGRSIRFLTPPTVERYIREHRLYQ